mmetsp:Transcript_26768/g.61687  ORF Transcript_26768/g.61687 Transcript_26768/m.61687 type:complete len:910 (-) Transcript_26768:14-2743(-)
MFFGGWPVNLSVTGCQKQAVGATIRGTYTLHSENHGKPVYRRNEELGNGMQVFIYFWREASSPNETGWWIGSIVGGSDVWAFHPDGASKSPPNAGWRIPFDGIVDPTVRIESIAAAPPKPSVSNNATFVPKDKPPPPKKDPPKPEEATKGKPGGVKDRLKHWLGGTASVEVTEPTQTDRPSEHVRFQQDEMWRKSPEERARLIKEQHDHAEAARHSPEAAYMAMDRLRRATAADFETLCAELEHIVILQEEQAGYAALREEAEQVIVHERDRIKTGGRETKRREGTAKRLVSELEAQVQALEVKAVECESLAEKMEQLKDVTHEKWELCGGEIEEKSEAAQSAHRACCTFVSTHRSTIEEATTILRETRAEVKALMVRAHAAISKATNSSQNSESALVSAVHHTMEAEKVAASKRLTEEYYEQLQSVFHVYDRDGDGRLNAQELKVCARSHFGIDLSAEAFDRVLCKLARSKQPSATLKTFHDVTTAIGIEREIERCERRRVAAEEKKMVFEEQCCLWLKDIENVSSVVEEVGQKVDEVVMEVRELGDHLREVNAQNLSEVIKHSDTVASNLVSVQAALVDVSQRVDEVCAYRQDPKMVALSAEMEICDWPDVVYQLIQRPGVFAARLCQASALRMELEAVVGAQRAALERVEQEKWAFTKYDDAGDGVLSKKKIAAYAKGEFNFEASAGALGRVYNKLHIAGEPGVSLRTLHLLKVAVGVERELERDAKRLCRREVRDMEFEEYRGSWWEECSNIAKSVEGLQKKIDFVSDEVEALRDQDEAVSQDARRKNAEEAGTVLKYLEVEVGTVCKRLYEMSVQKQPAKFQDIMQSEASQVKVLTAATTKLSEALEEMAAGYAVAKSAVPDEPVAEGAAVVTGSSGSAIPQSGKSAALSNAVTRPWMRAAKPP